MKTVLWVLLLLVAHGALAQDELKPGFSLLDSGKFAEGAHFFKTYLTTRDSTNRTALLCYGRGIGLSGSPTEAQRVFSSLLQRYPGDFEIGLNWAESLMWAKQYGDAKTYYEALIARQADSFAAVLGYANALSSLHDYGAALPQVEKALQLQPGNANALVSRKYMRLGQADQFGKNQKYTEATALLDAILKDFPADKDALFAKAQLLVTQEKYGQAEAIYTVLVWKPENAPNAYLGLSYLAFLQKKKPLALTYANKAIAAAANQPDRYLKMQLGRVSALGWNQKFKQAFASLDSLATRFPGNLDVAISRATLSVWSKQYGRGAELYKLALQQKPSSFDGNMGYADARHAEGNDTEAYRYVRKTLEYYPNQLDAMRFMQRLDAEHKPVVTAHGFVSQDNGGNVSTNYLLNGAFDLTTNFRVNVGYRNREVGTLTEGKTASVQTMYGGFRTRLTPFWAVSGNLGYVSLRKDNTLSHSYVNVINEFRLGRFQMADLRYTRDVQNYTAGLVGYNITYQNVVGSYNLATPFKLGVYSQYIQSFYSDDNRQHSLFASLYYDLCYAPMAKVGINYQNIGFKKQLPVIYFSPRRFSSLELFGQLENLNMPKQKILYQLSVAGGFQQIEREAWQPTYRLSLHLGLRPMKQGELLIYAQKSNIASSTVLGYSYSEVGIKAKWVLMK